jgi:formylglycine-generating enzyme required for sulfatase activity
MVLMFSDKLRTCAACVFAIITGMISTTAWAESTTTLAAADPHSTAGMVLLQGGHFMMGTDDGFPYEAPVHDVELSPFYIDRAEVTVGQFEQFANETHFQTDAERLGWSGVFDVDKGEWTKGDGANWRHPEGPGTTASATEPVVHISFDDAKAFAKWAGKRLPTEAEFEYAERGGLKGAKYAWGDELRPGGKPVANWWQGHFPENNTSEDGYLRRAPVGSFPPNGYGIYDLTGNVWEWTADWFDPDYFKNSAKQNPAGPEAGEERVLRGGGWMCSTNYCQGFRVAARNHTPPDSGLNNLGFRCARDAK